MHFVHYLLSPFFFLYFLSRLSFSVLFCVATKGVCSKVYFNIALRLRRTRIASLGCPCA